MEVGIASAGNASQLSRTRQQSHHVQNLFSEVLEAAGRRGYASAQKTSLVEGADVDAYGGEEKLVEAWEDWFQAVRSERYSNEKQPEELKQGFGEIIVRAHAEGGYVQPKEFLNSLSREELKVVQDVHHLAAPIQVDGLTEEGALNLLLPPPAQVDLNHDGLTQSGLAYGMRFPDSNTPPEAAAAWEEATAGMSFGERMIYEFQMMLPIMTANFHFDENGAYSHHYDPGDPEFVNPMADPSYSYAKAAQDRLDALDFVKAQMPSEQYERQTEFWNEMLDLLHEKGAS